MCFLLQSLDQMKELSSFINVIQNVPFKGLANGLENCKHTSEILLIELIYQNVLLIELIVKKKKMSRQHRRPCLKQKPPK